MSIVIITIPGKNKTDFAKILNKETGGAVKLVIIQKPKRESIFKRLKRLYSVVGFRGMLRELIYSLRIRLDRPMLAKLDYFRLSTDKKTSSLSMPKVIETDNVNGKEVEDALKKIAPRLLVVWGTALLKENILSKVGKAINLHMGYCPYYRGAVANQFALLNGDISHIGATIHYINDKADAGDTLSVIPCSPEKGPKELFTELNDKAFDKFLEIAKDLHNGKNIEASPQNIMVGKTLFLKEWIPSLRYKAAMLMSMWEDGAKENIKLHEDYIQRKI